MMKANNRVFGLDCLKLLCAFLVVCIHISFKIGGGYMHAAARIAVPVFFMITGYFYQPCVEKGNQLKQIKKILLLFIFCNILYFVFNSAVHIYSGDIYETLQSWFTLKSLLKFILFNESPFASHIWYLGAILYVLLIIYLFEKKFKRRHLYFLIPILLIINLLFGNFSMLIFGKPINNLFTRNFLFMGLPFFLIGDYIHNEKRLNPIHCKIIVSGILTVVFMAATFIEYYLLKHYGFLGTQELYISSIFCAVFIFAFCVKISNNDLNNAFINAISSAGKKNSTDIYIYHILINTCLSKIVSYVGILNTIYSYTAPILVFIVTLIFAIVLEAVLQKFKMIRKKHSSE